MQQAPPGRLPLQAIAAAALRSLFGLMSLCAAVDRCRVDYTLTRRGLMTVRVETPYGILDTCMLDSSCDEKTKTIASYTTTTIKRKITSIKQKINNADYAIRIEGESKIELLKPEHIEIKLPFIDFIAFKHCPTPCINDKDTVNTITAKIRSETYDARLPGRIIAVDRDTCAVFTDNGKSLVVYGTKAPLQQLSMLESKMFKEYPLFYYINDSHGFHVKDYAVVYVPDGCTVEYVIDDDLNVVRPSSVRRLAGNYVQVYNDTGVSAVLVYNKDKDKTIVYTREGIVSRYEAFSYKLIGYFMRPVGYVDGSPDSSSVAAKAVSLYKMAIKDKRVASEGLKKVEEIFGHDARLWNFDYLVSALVDRVLKIATAGQPIAISSIVVARPELARLVEEMLLEAARRGCISVQGGNIVVRCRDVVERLRQVATLVSA